MHFDTITSKLLKEKYFSYTHSSGVGILLYPMEKSSSVFATFATNYGSIDTIFKRHTDKDFIQVPEGIAHYLEHKMFESEEGDAFKLFAKTGASANAFTSFEKTCYLFSASSDFEENLKSLLTFVQDPYFTKENVEKEQGIIGQEINMYQDDANWRVMFNLLGSLFHNNPVSIDIAGTAASIAKIDKDLLYSCYNTFYNLNNMVIAVAGNFDVDSAIKVIEENLKTSEKVIIDREVPEEPDEIVKSYVEQTLSVSMPLFNIGFKEQSVSEAEQLKTEIISEMLMSAIAGRGSDLYERLYCDGLINNTFSSESFIGRGYNVSIFGGESKDPQRVAEELKKEIDVFKRNLLDHKTFERIKKAAFGHEIMTFSDTEEIALELVDAHFEKRTAYSALDILSSLRLEDVNAALQNMFQFDKMSLSVIKPQ